jgi:hypothetical protein
MITSGPHRLGRSRPAPSRDKSTAIRDGRGDARRLVSLKPLACRPRGALPRYGTNQLRSGARRRALLCFDRPCKHFNLQSKLRTCPSSPLGPVVAGASSFPAFNAFQPLDGRLLHSPSPLRGALRLALPFASSLAVQSLALTRGPCLSGLPSSPGSPVVFSARLG